MRIFVAWKDGTLNELTAEQIEWAADPNENGGDPIKFLESLGSVEEAEMGGDILRDLIVLLRQRKGVM